MSAYRSRYAVSSRVQPGVKALGKKATTTGPLSTNDESLSSTPSRSFTVKSGARSPTAGWAASSEVTSSASIRLVHNSAAPFALFHLCPRGSGGLAARARDLDHVERERLALPQSPEPVDHH